MAHMMPDHCSTKFGNEMDPRRNPNGISSVMLAVAFKGSSIFASQDEICPSSRESPAFGPKSSMSAPRRTAVKVNPVTGELQHAAPPPSGTQRSGCVNVPDKYIHAARDAGLGAEGGMFSHIKSLQRAGAEDLPAGEPSGLDSGPATGSSAPTAAPRRSALPPRSDRRPRGGAKAGTGSGAPRKQIRQVTQGRTRTVGTRASEKGSTPDVTFGKFKGVVNTFGGATDVKRSREAALPKRGERRPQVHGFDQSNGESRILPQNMTKKGSGTGGGAGPRRSAAPSGRSGGSDARGAAPVAGAENRGGRPTIVRKLGGKKTTEDGMSERERRAAFFERKFAGES